MEINHEELKLKAQAILLQEKEERKKRIIEKWENIPKLRKPKDVPILPQVSPEEWKEFYVPKLIEAGAIPKKDLLDGKYYFGDHRIAIIALWDEERNCFFYQRKKFNQTFEDKCSHFEDDNGFSLFVPLGEATEEEYKINKILDTKD